MALASKDHSVVHQCRGRNLRVHQLGFDELGVFGERLCGEHIVVAQQKVQPLVRITCHLCRISGGHSILFDKRRKRVSKLNSGFETPLIRGGQFYGFHRLLF